MKKGIFVALGMLACMNASAQDFSPYTPGEGEGIIYFLPKTALEVNVIATKVTYTPGEFCRYANRYMRMDGIPTQPETHWEIKQIDVRSVGVPDSTKVYIMKLKDKNVASNVELTNEGIVKAINTTSPAENQTDMYQLDKTEPHENARKYMTEDMLMAGSTAKMAELAAKEIYNIRDSKNQILRGQADAMPKDGASMKLVITNLDKQEKAMMEMFTGTTDREDKLFTFRITPEDDMNNKVAARFSRLLGVLGENNLSGDPIYLNVSAASSLPAAPTDDKKKKLKGVIYNIPGKGSVTVSYQGKTLFSGELPVTQFGYTEVLTDGLFDKKINTRVIFNPETGGIVKIDKNE